MADRVLTLRDLNRATLARQMLLERESIPVPSALERLVGLQAQLAVAPYVGLWTRLNAFTRDDLARLIEARKVVKATLMRATLHLVTTDDYLRLRATLQAVLTNAFDSIAKRRTARPLDVDKLVTAATQFVHEAPRSFAEISAMLTDLMPDEDVGAMRYAVRTHLPLIQVPIAGGWSYPGNPKFALADEWLGQPIPTETDRLGLVKRYLAAFGPATVADMQTWSGLQKLKGEFDELRSELVTFRDEKGRELFDLPDAPRPDAGTPAPERFLPEFDNLLLSHSDRRRVIADEYRSKVYLPGLRVAATILVDGFVHGVWKIEKTKQAATLVIEPLNTMTDGNRRALAEEGERLARFLEPNAKSYDVRFAE